MVGNAGVFAESVHGEVLAKEDAAGADPAASPEDGLARAGLELGLVELAPHGLDLVRVLGHRHGDGEDGGGGVERERSEDREHPSR